MKRPISDWWTGLRMELRCTYPAHPKGCPLHQDNTWRHRLLTRKKAA